MADNATWLGYTAVEASAAALKAGLDLDCGESWIFENGKPVMDFLTTYGMDAVRAGKMREADIDNALTNLYMTLMRLGYFDGMPKYESLNEKDICSDDHRSLALDGARQGMVLLKNHDNLLPLNADKLAAVTVHGPHAHAPEKVMDGDYTGDTLLLNLSCTTEQSLLLLFTARHITYSNVTHSLQIKIVVLL
jgi:beta-glucosidase-like glycosyl hydrolase